MSTNIVVRRTRDLSLPSAQNFTVEMAEDAEALVANTVSEVEDADVLVEWESQLSGLIAYLRGRDLAAPLMGAQRRVEARIGQLFAPPRRGSAPRTEREALAAELVPEAATRTAFRWLARALDGEVDLDVEEWRLPRDRLVALIRARLALDRPGGSRLGRPRTRGVKPEDRPEALKSIIGNAAAAAAMALSYTDRETLGRFRARERRTLARAVGRAERDLAKVRGKLEKA